MCISKLRNPATVSLAKSPVFGKAKHSPRLEDAYEDLNLVVNLTLTLFFFIFDFQENNLNVFTTTPIVLICIIMVSEIDKKYTFISL